MYNCNEHIVLMDSQIFLRTSRTEMYENGLGERLQRQHPEIRQVLRGVIISLMIVILTELFQLLWKIPLKFLRNKALVSLRVVLQISMQ